MQVESKEAGIVPARADAGKAAVKRLVLAEDEPLALKQLEMAVEAMPDMSVVAKARNGGEALTLIRKLQPDLVMLDIDMSNRAGVELVASLKPNDHMPELILISESDQHAAWAYELNAVDYLMKPISFERLRGALHRAQERLGSRALELRIVELQEQLFKLEASRRRPDSRHYYDEIWVRSGKELTKIAVAEVDMFEAAGDYVLTHVGGATHLLRESLSSLQSKLDPRQMIRVHRGSIVNLNRVRHLRRVNRRSKAIVLTNGAQITIGPNYREAVQEALDVNRWR